MDSCYSSDPIARDHIQTDIRTCKGSRVERRCWVNFQCRSVLLIRTIVGQGPIALAVGAGGGIWTFFSRLSILFFFSLSGKRPDMV